MTERPGVVTHAYNLSPEAGLQVQDQPRLRSTLPIYFYLFRTTANLGSAATLVVATLFHCQAEGNEIQHAYLPGIRFRVERTNGKSPTYHHPEEASWANQVSVHGNKQLAQ